MDRALLAELVDRNLAVSEIAKELEETVPKVRYWLDKHSLSTAGARRLGAGSPFTDAVFTAAVAGSINYAQLSRTLGTRASGSSYRTMKKRVASLGLDTSHFRRGQSSKRRTGPESYFVKLRRDAPRTSGPTLRRALLQTGRSYECETCGNDGTWMGKELTLQVDHRDGDSSNNLKGNLRFLCPNCHWQTPTFGRQRRDGASKNLLAKLRRCGCGRSKLEASITCVRCIPGRAKNLRVQPTRIEWPATSVLIQRLEDATYTALARELGVSDNAVRKRIENHPATRDQSDEAA